MTCPELSVVIPAYNEAVVIGQTLRAVARYLAGSAMHYEIIVVDDGSTDDTLATAQAVAETVPSIVVLHAPHQGKGAAVKQGIRRARGAYRLFMDADHSTRIEEVRKFLPCLLAGEEVVIGSRKMPGAVITARQSLLREWMGRRFTALTNWLLGVHVTDITCGFKIFRGQTAERLFRLQRLDGWGFDAEILFLATREGYRIKEIPVEWANNARTKVRLVRDAFHSLQELVMIRLGAWRGWYVSERPPLSP